MREVIELRQEPNRTLLTFAQIAGSLILNRSFVWNHLLREVSVKIFRYVGLMLVVLSMSAVCLAAEKTGDGFAVLTSEQLKGLLESKTAGLVVVDARTSQEYQEAHIHGAVNIPLTVLEKDSSALKAPHNARLVFYCNGVKCGKSGKSALIARSLGYTDIAIYADGMPVWEEKGYPLYTGPDYEKSVQTSKIKPAVVKALLESAPSTVTVVDVRDTKEFAEGHVPGAINIPVEAFAAGSGVLDKGRQIVVYCNSGGRSYTAYRKLQKLAYPNIAQMIFADWQSDGLPVAR
jgi:rhodanese-related sulfurtransferase